MRTDRERKKKRMASTYTQGATNLIFSSNPQKGKQYFKQSLSYNRMDVIVNVCDFKGVAYIHINKNNDSAKKQYISFDENEWKEFKNGIVKIDELMTQCVDKLEDKGKHQTPKKRKKQKVQFIGEALSDSSSDDSSTDEDEKKERKKRKKAAKKKAKVAKAKEVEEDEV